MAVSIVSQVASILNVDDREIARRLKVSCMTIKRWKKKEPPTYARFALAALATGVDPTMVFDQVGDKQCNQKATSRGARHL